MNRNAIVYVVDDDEGMRNSMAFVLKKAEINCKSFETGKQALDEWDSQTPGCWVVDYQMPEMTGLALVQDAHRRFGAIPFVLVTGVGTVPMAVEAIKMGAVTVIEKPFHHETFIDAVNEAITLDLQRLELANRELELSKKIKLLTTREREVANLVVEGCLTKQIAKQLGISVKTVEVHRSHITKKLGVESVAQLVKLLTPPRPR